MFTKCAFFWSWLCSGCWRGLSNVAFYRYQRSGPAFTMEGYCTSNTRGTFAGGIVVYGTIYLHLPFFILVEQCPGEVDIIGCTLLFV
jgi:hypothetical protein